MAEITRDLLLEKLSALRAQRDQAIANANAASGAIQILEELVAVIDHQPAPAPEGVKE